VGVDPENFAELVAIERASAQMHGRDPEYAEETVRERLRQAEENAERDARNAAEKEAARKWQARRKYVIGAGVVGGLALIVGLTLGARALMAMMARSDAFGVVLDEASIPLKSLGLEKREDFTDADPSRTTLSVPAGTCSAVIGVVQGSAVPVALAVVRPIGTSRGAGPHLWCACGEEEVTVSFSENPVGQVAVRWLTGAFDRVGGSMVLGHVKPDNGQLNVVPDDANCAFEAAAEWAKRQGHGVPTTANESEQARLPEGMTSLGTLPASQPFVSLPAADDICRLAEPLAEGGALRLRGEDGKLLAEANGALGWCVYASSPTLTLWREGGGSYLVSEAPAARVGGVTGLRELVERRAHGDATVALVGDDLEKDALATLAASDVSQAMSQTASANGLPGETDRRVVVATLRREGSLATADGSAIASTCKPAPQPDATVTSMFCLQAREQPWTGSGPVGSWGAAEAELPTWLWLLKDGGDVEQLKAMASILTLARRLHLAGFEPTTIDGVEKTVWGAAISARKNLRHAVAIGITKKAPWFHPLSDGEPWSLDDEPHLVAMPTEGKLVVKAERMLGFDAASRDVVVWRR
jgi:hypothetical protein